MTDRREIIRGIVPTGLEEGMQRRGGGKGEGRERGRRGNIWQDDGDLFELVP